MTQTPFSTEALIARDAAIDAELDTFSADSDIDRYSALCDEQATIYSAIASRDPQTAKAMLR